MLSVTLFRPDTAFAFAVTAPQSAESVTASNMIVSSWSVIALFALFACGASVPEVSFSGVAAFFGGGGFLVRVRLLGAEAVVFWLGVLSDSFFCGVKI